MAGWFIWFVGIVAARRWGGPARWRHVGEGESGVGGRYGQIAFPPGVTHPAGSFRHSVESPSSD